MSRPTYEDTPTWDMGAPRGSSLPSPPCRCALHSLIYPYPHPYVRCWHRMSPSSSSTLPVRVQPAKGSGPGKAGIEGVKQSCLGGKGTTSCRSQPSSGSARARNCMTPASRATGATSDAPATPQPPSLIGRVACIQAASETGVPTTASHVARWVAVYPSANAAVSWSGRVRRAY